MSAIERLLNSDILDNLQLFPDRAKTKIENVVERSLQQSAEYFKRQCSGKIENSPWIDIPCGDYKVILAIEDAEIQSLNQFIEKYHSLDKTSIKSQTGRIELLNTIGNFLGHLATQEKFAEQKGALLLLNKTVQSKKEYLKQLMEIPSDEAITQYHHDYSPLVGNRFEPLSLRNNSTYSLKMKEFWGNFWLESIDPCHRRLANYYQFWLNTKPISNNYQSFFLWLESQPIPKNVPIVEYYSDAQLEACHIKPVNGYLTKSMTNELVNTDPVKRNIFVINLLQEIYLEPWKEGVWHTSLSQGKPVLGAGLLQIEQGVVASYPFESGHYLPTLEQSFQSLQILREKGVRFKEPFEVIYFENRNKYKVLVSENHLGRFESFNKAIHETSKRELVSTNEF